MMNGNIDKNIRESFIESLSLECMELLIQSYRLAFRNKSFNKDWEEDSFTANLYGYLTQLQGEKQWIINPQVPIYDKQIKEGVISALTAPKPDLKFQKYAFSNEQPFEFYIESKNLSENDWTKTNGNRVSSSQQISRYIDTGIENYKTERYGRGCLAGYIVEGELFPIVIKINKSLRIRNRSDESLDFEIFINDFSNTCISNHLSCSNQELKLKHIFLKF